MWKRLSQLNDEFKEIKKSKKDAKKMSKKQLQNFYKTLM